MDKINDKKQIPTLFSSKVDCCACGACLNVCPKNAIKMREDDAGFIYPVIDEKKCIRCYQCKKVCNYQNRGKYNDPLKAYAAVNNDENQRMQSASGGIFSAIAKDVLLHDGVVYGAAFNKDWSVEHHRIDDYKELIELQGCKYTQSNTAFTFKSVLKDLKADKFVVYSGTPCQIDGLYGYLKKDYDNLLTVDIVCHGVPSNKMFNDYIASIEEKYDSNVSFFTFRDKNIGWGINGSLTIQNKKHKIWESASPYLYLFSKGKIYRENCYQCKYTSVHRPADLTLGDYWGIEKEHPELLDQLDERKGISLIIANSKKGQSYLNNLSKLDKYESTVEKVARGNAQLNHPTEKGNRDDLINTYINKGWQGLEERYRKEIGIKKYSSQLKSLVPRKVKRVLKK